MGNKNKNKIPLPVRMSRRKQTYEQRPKVQELLNTIVHMEFIDIIKKLDQYGLYYSGTVDQIKDRLFRYQIKIMDEKASYNWRQKTKGDFMPPTLQHALDIPSMDEQVRSLTLNSDVNRHVSELNGVRLRNPAYSAPVVTTAQYSQERSTYAKALTRNASSDQEVPTTSTAAPGVNANNPITLTTASCDLVMNTGYGRPANSNNLISETPQNSCVN